MTHKKPNRLIAVGLLFLCATACKLASYEFVGGKSGANAPQGSDASPDPSATNMASPIPNLPPTARVEVHDGADIVTSSIAGKNLTIVPSPDTVDADDAAKAPACQNAGIVEVRYDFGDGKTQTVKRDKDDCSSLGFDHIFDNPGLFEIKMVVVSDEGEEASASLAFRVTQPADPSSTPNPNPANSPSPAPSPSPSVVQGPSFQIKADPLLATVEQVINFTSDCKTTKNFTVTWQFGDQSTSTGITTTHGYTNAGQYVVEGKCTEQDGEVLISTVTIVILPGGNSSASPDPSANPSGNPTTNPTGNPSSNPSASGTPSVGPSTNPSGNPTSSPSVSASPTPTAKPTPTPTPTIKPTPTPTQTPKIPVQTPVQNPVQSPAQSK